MYLKRIDIHGFKSFSDPVSIELTDGITFSICFWFGFLPV